MGLEVSKKTTSRALYYVVLLVATSTACNQVSRKLQPTADGASIRGAGFVTLRKIGDLPEKNGWFSIQFEDKQRGWLANGLNLWRTTDGGRNWNVIYKVDEHEFVERIDKVFFVNSCKGWMLRPSGFYRTIDQGITWAAVTTPLDYPKGSLVSFYFSNDKDGWIVGGLYHPKSLKDFLRESHPNEAVITRQDNSRAVLQASIFRTYDGGETWHECSIPSVSYRIILINFSDSDHGVIVGDEDVMSTEDGGKNWRLSIFPKECNDQNRENIYEYGPIALSFLDRHGGWLSYKDGRLAKSTDGGHSWCDLLQPQEVWAPDEQNAFFQKLYFTDTLNGWGLKANGSLFGTENGGVTWVNVDTSIRYDDLFFLNKEYGWSVSKEGLFQFEGRAP
ncbi:MAG: hypothetical protein LC802_10000 [Acidobacteria bacterium]|nr:hypothetical protein [Acidobacteriota bacterium]